MLRHLNVDLLCVPDAWDVEPQTFGKETDGQVTLARQAEICAGGSTSRPSARRRDVRQAARRREGKVGTLLLIGEHPFKIGDSIVVNNMEGTVESVGFRST